MRRLLFTLVVVIGVLAVADRAALAAAEMQLAAEVQSEEGLAERPSINLLGFPFLTQAVRGRYDGGRLEMRNLRTERLLVNRLVIDLRDVEVPLADLISNNVSAVPVGRVTGVAMVSYAELAKATGVPGLQIRPAGDKLELRFAVDVFGTSTPVVATARIGVAKQAVRITSEQVGASLPEELTATALTQVQSSIAFGVLPYGLQVSDVRVAATGVEVTAAAQNTVLRPAPA